MSGGPERPRNQECVPSVSLHTGIDRERRKKMLSQARVQELFDYREDGELIWRVQVSSRALVGNVAGCLNGKGYKVTGIDGKLYRNHRLIWLWNFGYFPENDLDHINRIRDDNRIENLREVSRVCNMRNARVYKDSFSGVTGVCWRKETSKWSARIKISSKNIYLGHYETKLEAAKARWQAEVKYGFPNCNTTSSALKYIKENDNEKENDRGTTDPRDANRIQFRVQAQRSEEVLLHPGR
jgi:hypothetical protein